VDLDISPLARCLPSRGIAEGLLPTHACEVSFPIAVATNRISVRAGLSEMTLVAASVAKVMWAGNGCIHRGRGVAKTWASLYLTGALLHLMKLGIHWEFPLNGIPDGSGQQTEEKALQKGRRDNGDSGETFTSQGVDL